MKNSILLLSATFTILLITSCNEDDPVTPRNGAPTAILTVDQTTGSAPLTVRFDASESSDPEEEALTFSWDFGDGDQASSSSVTHTFQEAGSYNVTLTVTDPEGAEDTDQITINVDQPVDLFPLTENAQWVYRVASEKAENGNVTGYEEGILYLTVVSVQRTGDTDYVELRVTGKRIYNGIGYNKRIFIEHKAGQSIKVKHKASDPYRPMIDLNASSWSGYSMFFSTSSSNSVTQTSSSANVPAGNFQGIQITYADDNWGEQYVLERYDLMNRELHSPQVGLVLRETSRWVDFLDCFTCPVYTGASRMELIGYYIPQPDGSVLEGGTGYNPDNPYGGNQGILTIWNSYDFGPISVYIDEEFAGRIDANFPAGVSCDQDDALNISRPDGTYQLRAQSSQYVWAGTVTFREGVCDDIQLVL